jgi:hypothetical protein
VLKRVAHKIGLSYVATLTTEFQTISGINVGKLTVFWELHEICFHGRAVAHKPMITMRNAKRWLQWCKPHCHWTMEEWKRVLWNDELCFTIWQSNGLADARKTLPAPMHSAKCKVWWKRNNGLGLFFMVRLSPLVPVEGNLNATAYNDIVDDSVLPTLWQQFGEGPFLLQHDNATVYKANSIQK